MLADDNADMRDYLARLLRERWDVEAVADGREALGGDPPRATRSRSPRRHDARPRRVRPAPRSPRRPRAAVLPVILLSARAGEEDRSKAWRSGADDYIIKPFSRRELLARITHLKMARLRIRAEQNLRKARDDALAANRAKDEFLATLFHELRTPLIRVLFVSSEASADPSLSEEVRADFKAIADNVSLQARLIDDLLDFNRIIRGKFAIERDALNLHDIIREATAAVRRDQGTVARPSPFRSPRTVMASRVTRCACGRSFGTSSRTRSNSRSRGVRSRS